MAAVRAALDMVYFKRDGKYQKDASTGDYLNPSDPDNCDCCGGCPGSGCSFPPDNGPTVSGFTETCCDNNVNVTLDQTLGYDDSTSGERLWTFERGRVLLEILCCTSEDKLYARLDQTECHDTRIGSIYGGSTTPGCRSAAEWKEITEAVSCSSATWSGSFDLDAVQKGDLCTADTITITF